jgi:hypothetical protein
MSTEGEPEAFWRRDRRATLVVVTTGLVAFGIALRLARYLLNFPLWCDETMLAANLLGRGWGDLAKPLEYRQVCPLGFLALEWLVVKGLGFSEASLRIGALLSALASVPVFALVARRALGPGSMGAVLALGLFAVAQTPIRYAAEFKPYATDLLVASVLLWLALRWREAPGRSRWVWALAAFAPFAVALSLPSAFVLAAIEVVGLLEVAMVRRRGVTTAYLALLVSAGLGVGLLAALGQYTTTPESREYFLKFWANGFPPSWQHPGDLLRWLVRVHTGPLFTYPLEPGKAFIWTNLVVLAAFLVGLAVAARRDWRTAALLVLPFGLTLAAAALRRYPYGMNPRVGQYLVPSTLILAAGGAEWLIARLRSESLRKRAVLTLLGLLVVVGAWRMSVDLTRPYRTPWDRTGRDFARWFWTELAADAELVCLTTDLGIPLESKAWSYDGLDQYLCYQRIYSPRHAKHRPPNWNAVSASHPLRCVLLNRGPADVPAFCDWLVANQDRFPLRDTRVYPATRGSAAEPRLIYVICELVPRTPVTAATVPPVQRR